MSLRESVTTTEQPSRARGTSFVHWLYIALFVSVVIVSLVAGFTLESSAHPHAPIKFSFQDLVKDAKPIDDADQEKTLDDLMHDRLERERVRLMSTGYQPEILRLEANYIRTSNSAPDVVLYESSFHLEPRYMSFSSLGKDTTTSKTPGGSQAVMYFVGSARTPLALPIVSNLSQALKGDAASYTVNIAILPLPTTTATGSDTVRFYVIIERAIESNRTESIVKIERFAKEFATRISEPIQLQLENAPPERQTYVKLEDGSILKFFEDFARYFDEHILLNGERLKFTVGKAQISPVSSRLSIPYSVGQNSRVRVEVLSVVDTTHPFVVLDTLRRPADYLTELDMKPFADGPYRYRYTAYDPSTNKVLFSETRNFSKSSPVLVEPGADFRRADTLIVGGKREDAMAMFRRLNSELQVVQAKSERLESSLNIATHENVDLQKYIEANKRNSIGGFRVRAGIEVFNQSAGDAVFFGVESTSPIVTFDVSFGYLYGGAPYLTYSKPKNFSQLLTSPKSLGLNLAYIPAKFFDNVLMPYLGIGYYGIWSSATTSDATRSATLLVPGFGVAIDPFGENTALGVSLGLGEIVGLGVSGPAQTEVNGKIYFRF